ncbi:uncharacterized protein [Physcomitrium patens]|uniref:uncharacterized protein n=1 Tax=Physcomitrium patens TaxID=3218 RepID=UPI003CCE191C
MAPSDVGDATEQTCGTSSMIKSTRRNRWTSSHEYSTNYSCATQGLELQLDLSKINAHSFYK